MEKAIALKYTPDYPAPFIAASGRGELARRIKRIAAENHIHIAEIPDLADSLIVLDVGSLIPEGYYEIIAELLIFAMELGEGP
jgi:type III secretion system FlhB-like substrate exporter